MRWEKESHASGANMNLALWMFLPLRANDELFHQPVTCKHITIHGIQFAYISSCYVPQTLSGCEEKSLFKRYAYKADGWIPIVAVGGESSCGWHYSISASRGKCITGCCVLFGSPCRYRYQHEHQMHSKQILCARRIAD